jgi:type IV pilus assembly protein PilE
MKTVLLTLGTLRDLPLRSRIQGVTLLELMAVIMVIGILAAIAIPSYRQYVMRAHRAEAKAALLRLATNQERFYLQNRRYGSVEDLVDAALLEEGGLSERGTYQITIDGPDATTYRATARPVDGGAYDMRDDAQCTSFSITPLGERAATGSAVDRCW